MAYLVSLALLVALAAWIVGIYNNLEHLREVVCNCWGQWRRVTHQRNERLSDFTAELATHLPTGDSLPRELRRMVDDSERSLALALEPRWNKVHGFMGRAEQLLRFAAERSVQVVEDSPTLRSHEALQRLCSSMTISLYQQEQATTLFNLAAREYNAALAAPSARFLAPVLGFMAADTLEPDA